MCGRACCQVGQPSPCHDSAALLSAAGRSTQANGLFLGRFASPVSLPQVRCTDEGYRTAHRSRPATSFPSKDQRCGMKPSSPTPTHRVLWCAPYSFALLPNISLPLAPLTPHFVITLLRPPHLRPCRQLLRSAEQPRRICAPLPPTIEFP